MQTAENMDTAKRCWLIRV